MQLPLPRARRHARAPLSCTLTLALGLLLGLTLTPARAATLTVTSAADDGSADTLRSVVAAAGAGDTVVFAPNVTLITLKQGQITLSNPITIQGPGAALLAIDGNQNGRVFAIVNSTGVAALSGLTIQNGAVNNDVGGGVFVSTGANASAQLTACILSGNNSGSGFGGGLYNGGTVTLIGCQVSGNNASLGGGLYNAGPMTLSGCAIKGNRAANGGGPGNAGGGLSNDGPATITDCAFVGNSSPMEGGAIDNGLGLTLSDCLLVGNSAAIGGAVNNVGVGGLGGGGSVTATGCTFTGNAASNSGGGAALNNNNGAAATLTDDILTDTGGETYNDPGMPGNPDDPASTATVSHCDFPGGVPSGLTDGGGNTSGPADFVTPYTAAGAAFDLHLKSGSACIGAGTTSAPGSSYLPADIDGRARPSTPSIGAYEAPPAGPYSLVVENTLDGVPMSLRTAVQCADAYPDARITFDPTAFATFQTITETQGTLTLSQPMTITGPAAGVAVDGNKANSVFTVTGGTGSGPIALSGLTVRNGRAGESFYPSDAGGGVYNDNGTLTLTGCTLEGNSASYFGGGVFNDTGTLTLTGCTLTGNSAPNGGGVYNTVGTVTLTGCTLEGNSAQGGTGGGVFNDDHGTVTLTDDILYGDTGGEVHDLAYASVSATYCDIGQSGYAGSNGNIDADPLLSPLGNYGGPTQTFALLPGSPCLGAGVAVSGVTTDQRGVSRAQAHGTDIGAFESQGFIVFIMSGGGQQAVVGTAFPQPLQAQVASRSGTEPVAGGALSFDAPASGASASFSPSPATVAAGGYASPVTATANAQVGSYSVTGDTGAGASNPFTLTNVAPLGLIVKANPSTSTYDQPVNLFATLSGGVSPTGTITFYDGAIQPGSPLPPQIGAAKTVSGDGTYSVGTSALSVGGHTITAVYSGDANNPGVSATTTLTVGQVSTQLQVSAGPSQSVYGQPVKLRATLQSGISPTGTITFYDGPASGGVQIGAAQIVTGNGDYSVNTSSLSVARHTITAVYSGDADNKTATASTVENVSKDDTTTAVGSSSPGNASAAGQGVTFTATVTARAPGAGMPTGTVSFYLNGSQTPFDTETLSSGAATSQPQTFTAAGQYLVTAAYNGDGDFNASQGRLSPDQQVGPGPAAALTLTAPSTATAGQSFSVTVRETDAYGNPVTSAATVTFTSTDPRAALPASVSLVNGADTVTVTDYTAGSQTLTASASGLTPGTAAMTVSSDPNGTPNVSVNNVVLTRGTGASSSVVTVSFTLVNTGVGQASSVTVTVARIGTVSASSLPAPVSIGAGQSQPYSLTFNNVPPGLTTLTLSGTYTGTPGGKPTGYAFSGGKKVTVP